MDTAVPQMAPAAAGEYDPSTAASEWLRAGVRTAAQNTVALMMRKGGSGKTSLTLLLADSLARFGLSVLVIDMDPQGNSCIGLGRPVRMIQQGTQRLGNRPVMAPDVLTVVEVIDSGEPGVADQAITLIDWGYDLEDPFLRGGPLFPGRLGQIGLVPAYEALDALAAVWTPADMERLGKTLLLPAPDGDGIAPNARWDVVLLDTPHGAHLLQIQAAKAAHKVLLVTQAEKFGADAVAKTVLMVDEIRTQYRAGVEVIGLVFNEYDPRRRTQRNLSQQVKGAQEAGVPEVSMPIWPCRIPNRSVIGDSQLSEAPVSAFLARSSSRAAAAAVCQQAEATAIRLLEAIGHPRASDIKQAWMRAWPTGQQRPDNPEV